MYSGSRLPDQPASPGTSSASSVSGSTSTLHETPRQQGATYGASYTVTSITPSDERLQGAPEAHEGPKWSGFVALDSEPRPTKSVGVTLTAHTASGTLYAIASGPSSPPMSPRTPETPIFGSTSQRHRRVVLNGQGNGDTPRLDGNAHESRMPPDSFGTLRVNIDPIAVTPSNGNTREQGLEAANGEKMQAAAMPFKETSLGAVITTVNTYKQKQSFEDITEASMSDTVDQIERAFGFKTPDMIANGTGSLERTGSTRLKNGNRSPSNSMQDLHLSRRAQSGESLNRNRSSDDEDSPANILKRLSKEANKEHDRGLQRKSEGDLPQNVIKSKTATVMEASPTSVEVKKEAVRKSEYEARMAARNLLIERLENHRQSLEGDSVEGIKIYHAKSRSTPAEGGRTLNGEKVTRPRQSSHDDTAKMLSSERDGGDAVKMAHHSRRKKSSESPHVKVRTPDSSRAAKPVVRSERKIRLTSSTSSGSHAVDKSQTVPRQRSSRRQRHVNRQLVAAAGGNSDSSDEERKARLTRGGDSVDATPTVAGKLHFTPERNKKSSSLPRELEAGTSPRASDTREIRSHRSHSHSHSSHLKGARITKIKMSASEEPNDSIVDQTSRLLHAAKGVKYDKGSSLVIAEDVLHSLTRASDLLHHQSSAAREERDRKDKDKDKSLSRIKAPGKCRGDCKGWGGDWEGEKFLETVASANARINLCS